MQGVFRAGAVVLTIYGGTAAAQTATETTTTQSTTYPAPPSYVAPPPAPLVPPPAGTLATIRTTRAVDAYGNEVDQQKTTYRNSQGVAEDSRTVTRVVPPPPAVSTTTTTTTQQTTGVPN